MKRQGILKAFAGFVVALALAIGIMAETPATADYNGPSTLYCLLSGCTMTGTLTASDGGTWGTGGISTTQPITAASLNVTSSTIPTNGLYLSAANVPGVSANGALVIAFAGTNINAKQPIFANSSSGAEINSAAASATVPSLIPNRGSATTGWGADTGGDISGILGGVEFLRLAVGGPIWKGTIPTVTGTGTPTIATGSTDTAGEVTSGTSATSVVITFSATKGNAPFCVVSPQTQLVAFSFTISTTAISITQTATTGEKIDYMCFQH